MPRKPRDADDDSKLRPDTNEIAFRTVQAALGEAPKPLPPGEGDKNPKAVKRGRAGGIKGGPARKVQTSAKRLRASAKKAAKARWPKKP